MGAFGTSPNTMVRVQDEGGAQPVSAMFQGPANDKITTFYRQMAGARQRGVSNYIHKVVFIDGFIVDYTYNTGLEYLTITVPGVKFGKKKEEEEEEKKARETTCLLIFHGGNRVSAYDMTTLPSKLEDGRPARVYARELRKSSWGEEILPTMQLKLKEGTQSIAMSPLVVNHNAASVDRNYHLTLCNSYGASLKQFAKTRLTITAGSEDHGDFCYTIPFINGNGEMIYTPTDIYRVVKGEITQVKDAADPAVLPMMISATGEYYYHPRVQANPSTNLNVGLPFIQNTVYWSAPDPDYTADAIAHNPSTWWVTFTQYWQNNNTGDIVVDNDGNPGLPSHWMDWSLYRRDGTFYNPLGYSWYSMGLEGPPTTEVFQSRYVLVHRDIWTAPNGSNSFTEVVGSHSGDISQPMPYPMYSNNGKIDTLNIAMPMMTSILTHDEWYSGTGGVPVHDTGTFTFLGHDYPSDYLWTGVGADEIRTPSKRVSVETFPPSFDKDKHFLGCLTEHAWTDPTPDTKEIFTPYGTFTMELGGENMDPRDGFGRYRPWLHVSNGQHVIQGFVTGTEYHLYCNEIDLSDMLTEDRLYLKDIQTMFMDVPLSRVMELV